MRLSIVKSKNAKQFYIIKDYKDKSGKRTLGLKIILKI